MAWQSLTLTLHNKEDADQFEDFLLKLGAVSITYSDAGDDPILEPDLNTTPLWKKTFLTALFEETTELFVVSTALANNFGLERFTIADARKIEDKNWEREWLKHFEPMKFGHRLWVCPSGMQIPEDEKNKADVVINLDPGLAFGTGTHETTALCLEKLDGLDLKNKQVLDFGCGSGILAIAAHKLGAKAVYGIDIDPQAITATLDNAERNNIDSGLYVYVTEDEDEEDGLSWNKPNSYDVVIANILSKPLIELSEKITTLLKPEGQLILSGIMLDQADQVRSAYHKLISLDETSILGDWIALSGKKTESRKTTGQQLDINYGKKEPTLSSLPDIHDTPNTQVKQTTTVNLEKITLDKNSILGKTEIEKEVLAIKHCPHCNHVQSFDLYDLEYADGKARCDNCHKIYNAYTAEDVAIEADTILNQKEVSENSDIPHLNTEDIRKLKPKLKRKATVHPFGQTGEFTLEATIKSDIRTNTAQNSQQASLTLKPKKPVKPEKIEKEDFLPPLLELDDTPAKKPLRFKFVWLCMALLASLAVLAQYIHHNRAELALRADIGQRIQLLYAQLGLELEPKWDLSLYKSISNSVSLNPYDNQQLIINSVIQNTADIPQPYPTLRVSLQNRWGESIAIGDFSPSDYLETNEATQLLPAKESVLIRIAVDDPGNEAMDYKSDVCLETGLTPRTIQCQRGG